jgi:hypothetical protein
MVFVLIKTLFLLSYNSIIYFLEPTIEDVSQTAFVNINGSSVSVNITDSRQNKIEDVKV